MSLHWILALTMTLLHCLMALPITEFDFKDIGNHINRVKNFGCNEPDSAFYTPSGNHNCTIEALDCSMLEMKKYATECTSKTEDIQAVNRTIELINLILKHNKVTLNENYKNCFCGGEKPGEQPYDKFFKNIMTLFQKLNSRA